MPATCWEALVGTGFKSPWVWISVAVPVAYLAMLSLWLACRGIKWTDTTYHSLGMRQRHECYRLGNDCKQFKLSHKPGVAGLNCGGWQYNKRNFTIILTYTLICNVVPQSIFMTPDSSICPICESKSFNTHVDGIVTFQRVIVECHVGICNIWSAATVSCNKQMR